MAGYNQNKPIGLPDEKAFDERVLHVNRVARVVKGGRRFRFQALVLVGDRKGQVGIGISKGADVSAAVKKATDVAKKQLQSFPIYKGTLAHEVEAKVSGSHILLIPASAGTGLIAGGIVRSILEVAGFENAMSKSFGSSNKINTAYATLAALNSLVSADKWVTRANRSDSRLTVKSRQSQVRKVATVAPVGATNE